MSAMFSSLRIRNYRIYAAGGIVSNTGTWMGRVAQDWVVLTELTNGSAQALGIVTGLQFLPMLLLAPVAGAVSDRFAKRRVMVVTQSVMGLTAALMGLLVLLGVMELWHMYLLALLQGSAAAIDAPARQAFVSEMVPPEQLTNAVGLNSASFHGGRLIGPAVAGLLIAWFGTGPTFLINAATFIAVIGALVAMDPARLTPAPRSKGKGRIREGLAYVRHRPDIMLIMALIFVHGTFGMNFQITNALMSTEVFDKGVEEYGLVGSVMAIGSLGGALLAARRERPRLRYLLGAMGGFSVCTLLLGLAPTFEVFTVTLIPTGLCALTVMVTANSMVQLSVDPAVRGRVMALYLAVFMGGTPLGSPIIGWIGDQFGARWTMLMAAFMCGAAVLAATIYVMRTDNIHVRIQRDGRRRLTLHRGPVQPLPERIS
ncbi:MFS transporter [Ornithinicoccus hortensis]|uniref:Putative MFS family arabinose efflux permease n=1 Tax=Ornithinicoccus hortensis TaxID=82346 RepID=A0A542YVQ2_9MICO|nr:MFS transporter [Ornithinicoccus hortensis]TQL52168.1 putative MFS family arabinose efflux permease [Ornithinicoccus hortensis]